MVAKPWGEGFRGSAWFGAPTLGKAPQALIDHWPWVLAVGLGWVLLVSLTTGALLAWDKRQAKKGGWRVPEARLHWFEALGGSPGSWLFRRWLRHKTVKPRYRWVYRAIVAGQLMVVGALVWWLLR